MFKTPYTHLVYKPMLELLDYLRANGFKTFIVSGGGIEFMRPWAKRSTVFRRNRWWAAASRPSSRCVMESRSWSACRRSISSMTRPASRSGSTSISGDVPSLPSAIPTATCRCCNGQPAGEGKRFACIVHHTDAERECAYDRDSHVGRLDKALDEATKNGWTVVDMQRDWKRSTRQVSN